MHDARLTPRLSQAQLHDQRLCGQGVMPKRCPAAEGNSGNPRKTGMPCHSQAGKVDRQRMRPRRRAGAVHVLRDKQPALELLKIAELTLQLQSHQFLANGQVGEIDQVPTGAPGGAVRRLQIILKGNILHGATAADPHDGGVFAGRRNDRLSQKMVSRNTGLEVFCVQLIRGVPELLLNRLLVEQGFRRCNGF